MNHIQFAIASIVDANTGNGLVHDGNRINYAAAASNGRSIRARSVLELSARIKGLLSNALQSIREHYQEKRKIHNLAALDDHILEDIGITRGDVVALQLGQIDLEQLEAQRSVTRAATHSQQAATTQRVDTQLRGNALNEAVFARAKCA